VQRRGEAYNSLLEANGLGERLVRQRATLGLLREYVSAIKEGGSALNREHSPCTQEPDPAKVFSVPTFNRMPLRSRINVAPARAFQHSHSTSRS
jgi:hypothetical protein